MDVTNVSLMAPIKANVSGRKKERGKITYDKWSMTQSTEVNSVVQ